MVSKFGYHGLIAFIAIAIVIFGATKMPEVLEFLRRQLRDSKGLAKRLRMTLKR